MSRLSSALPEFDDDGFVTTAAEPWFRLKVQLFERYLISWFSNLSGRADEFVFVDLAAGPGLYAIGNNRDRERFPQPCLVSLAADLPVSKWIFCEESPECAAALKVRVNRYFRGKNVQIFEDTPDHLIDKLRFYIPQSKGKHKVAVFCLADPFSFQIGFDTLSKLKGLGFNFLIPYTFPLNERVDFRFYMREYRERIATFLGGKMNLDQLESGLGSNLQFYKRLVRIHQNEMLTLGFSTSLTVHKLESSLMQVPLFYLGLFSSVFPARFIQRDVQAGTHLQYALF